MLTRDKQHLSIIDNGIIINWNLPKWKNIKTQKEKEFNGDLDTNEATDGVAYVNFNVNNFSNSTNAVNSENQQILFEKVASSGLKALNEMIKCGELKNITNAYSKYEVGLTLSASNTFGTNVVFDKKESWIKRLIKRFEKKEETFELDAVDFFTNVKSTTKESAEKYVNRVSKYLTAIYNAYSVGQTALIQNLIKNIITNKYESVLYSEGYYYVITEKQIVDFAKKTEKGISLTYIKNYAKPLPQEVIDKINEVNNLEVFDNYVILHYDPEGEVYLETEKEKEKRKDPILFGLIGGSDKLYYITDWVDEYCDLTLDEFVDKLGINKESLKMSEEI